MRRAGRIPIPDTAFRMSHGRKRPRIEDGNHLAWIRNLPCVVTGRRDGIEAAHCRYGDALFGKRDIPATEACKAAAGALRFQAAALEDAKDDPAQDLYDAYQRLAEIDDDK